MLISQLLKTCQRITGKDSRFIFPFFFCLLSIFISSCTLKPTDSKYKKDSAPSYVPIDVLAIPDATPIHEIRTRAGNSATYKVLGKQYKVLANSQGYKKQGIASWYGTKFHGRKTANGEIYDMYAMTAAHKTLPIPCYVRVTHLKNKRSVVVRINDRGPFYADRIIDLSYTAAVKLGIQQAGTGLVEVVTIEPEPVAKLAKKSIQLSQNQADSLVYIQVGVFSHQDNARQLQEKLSSSQIKNSRIKIDHSQDHERYKVQIGPFYSANQVNKVNEKLASLAIIDIHYLVEKNAPRLP